MKNKRILIIAALAIFVLLFLTGCKGNTEDPITENSFFLIRGFAWIFNFFAGLFDNNYGLGIVFTTILIRLVAWPIYAQSNDMMLKMQLMQPDMDRVRAKYATKKDPESQQKMQMEMMKLWRTYKINPIGCILMQAAQMIIFITMFQVVRRITIEGGLYSDMSMDFLWWDLSFQYGRNDIVLTLLVAVVMFGQQFISQRKPKYIKKYPTSPSNQTQSQQKMTKMMMYFMVLMMAFIAWGSNALALYWIVGTTISIGQILIGKKISEKKFYKMKGIIPGDK
ncbi:MAG: membrane protein insertase YidC [Erysipelotrichales bacterium]|nr:membrane protein insertase YidC [Erysipelotrichales bacterium]